ncbi:MAG: ABC transporter ATP-binding protein [Deltaproteobacteria bacterium]|nr:ABC transporter ATP-binding protein [Deltaproteobacteria bacterium]
MSEAIAIRIRDLHKTFHLGLRRKKVPALLGLDLDVRAGQVFGFLGPNGAGKTTAIKILIGLLRADRGETFLLGRPSAHCRARARVAYLPELPDFYDYLRPGEFLAHCGRLSGLDRDTLRARVPALLERVGLNPAERRPMRKFSRGMLQRVGIAQALLADPELYILDEPMGGLDPIGRRWIKDLLHELGERGKTVFFSSHVLAEAEAVCDEAAFLFRGRLIAQGSLHELLGHEQQQAWEVLVEGEAVREHEAICKLAAEVQVAGGDTLLVLDAEARPEPVVTALAQAGLRLRSVSLRHASLEDVFIRRVEREG